MPMKRRWKSVIERANAEVSEEHLPQTKHKSHRRLIFTHVASLQILHRLSDQ